MIHISDLSWTRKYSHPSELLQKGNNVKCVVLDVNEAKQRISLGIKQLTEDPWARAIPEKYIPGHIIKGVVTKLTNFGAFVELEPELEGLLHISELADHKIDKPQDVVKEGDEIEVKILKVDTDSRKIGLSLRRARWAAEEQAAVKAVQQEVPSTAEEIASDTDADTDRQPEPEAKAGEPAETKPVQAEPGEQASESAEIETGDVKKPEDASKPKSKRTSKAEKTDENTKTDKQTGDDSTASQNAESDTDN